MTDSTNTVYSFVRHCLSDSEFNVGGIPTKEKEYLKKLHWTQNDERTNRFYNAIYELKYLADQQNETDKMRIK